MVAAITACENGATVELYEAHDRLGGRARSLDGAWRANWGPHALYCDGPLWAWLAERDLIPPVTRPALTGLRFRCDGEALRSASPAATRPSRRRATASCRRRSACGEVSRSTTVSVASRR